MMVITTQSIKFWTLSMSIDNEDLKGLVERARRMKNNVLMEEPCPIYEADEEDWDDFWCNEDTE